ncbi:MAG: WG repeat-containing protein [Bacteroidales bacterium]|nr:WG repeat-containing protein [Bacteroidales bacterium]
MKKTIFLLILAAATLGVYGQELKPYPNRNGLYGYVDKKTGTLVIPCKYDWAYPFSEGLAAVNHNGKRGYIDATGREVIPCKYERGEHFHEGLVAVRLNGKWGYINKIGEVMIPFKYDKVSDFSEDFAAVQLNGKWGGIDRTGTVIVPLEYNSWKKVQDAAKKIEKKPFDVFAKGYVEIRINEWQKKGEYENTAEWQQRVNETTRQAKVTELLKDAEREYIAIRAKTVYHTMELGTYDADNQVFLVKSDLSGNLLVPVPKNEGQDFKANWDKVTKTPTYFIENDKLGLAEMTFTTPTGKTYKYSNQASLNYTVAQIDYNFAPINIDVPTQTTSGGGSQNINTVNLQAGKSDIATPPKTTTKNDNTFAVIIANENYQNESQVLFAKNDGETFKQYCINTLGIPDQRVHFVVNATLNNIRDEVDWISAVAKAHKGEISIIFYYAGHGIPDESSKSAYLLPVDGRGSNVKTCYKLDELYADLGALPAKSIIVFMDACFSGTQRSGEMLASARGVAIKSMPGEPKGNMIVFSAAQGDETAYPYRDKGHGMFTYFLLKKLQETKGAVTLGELGDYITDKVHKQSIEVNRKSQTPTVNPSYIMADEWRGMKLPGF